MKLVLLFQKIAKRRNNEAKENKYISIAVRFLLRIPSGFFAGIFSKDT